MTHSAEALAAISNPFVVSEGLTPAAAQQEEYARRRRAAARTERAVLAEVKAPRYSSASDRQGADDMVDAVLGTQYGDYELYDFVRTHKTALLRLDAEGVQLREEAVQRGWIVEPLISTTSSGNQTRTGFAFIDLTTDEPLEDGTPVGRAVTLATASGAKENEDGQVDYLMSLAAFLMRWETRELHPGRPDRLSRTDFVENLERAIMFHDTLVYAFGMKVSLNTFVGRTMWGNWMLGAKMARDAIVFNLSDGQLRKAVSKGAWPRWGGQGLAHGLTTDDDGMIVLAGDTPEERARYLEQVRLIIESTSWVNLDYNAIATRLGAAGITSATIIKKHGPGATIADTVASGGASSAVQSLWGGTTGRLQPKLEQYLFHMVSYRQTYAAGTMYGRDQHRAHLEFVGEQGKQAQWQPVVYHLPRPDTQDGQWAPEAVIRQAILDRNARYAARGKGTRAKRKPTMKPLAGLPVWEVAQPDGTVLQYKLDAHRPNTYELRVRPTTRDSWKTVPGALIASVPDSDVRQAIAAAIRQTLRERSPVLLTAAGTAVTSLMDPTADARVKAAELTARMQTLTREAEATTAQAASFRAQRTGDQDVDAAAEEAAVDAERKALEKRVEIRQLQRELDATTGPDAHNPATPTDVIDPNVPLALAELLDRTDELLPRRVVEVLLSMLGDSFRLEPMDNLRSRITFALKFRTATREFITAEHSATVRNRTNRATDGTRAADARGQEMAQMFMADGLSIDKIAAEVRRTSGWAGRSIREWIQKQDVIHQPRATALMRCPIPTTRQVLWAHLTDNAPPASVDRATAALIVTAYTTDTVPWGNHWAMDTRLARRAVAWLERFSDTPDTGASVDDLVTALGVTRRTVVDLTRPIKKVSSRIVMPVLEKVGTWNAATEPSTWRVRLPYCHTCHTHSPAHIIQVPEVPQGMLCRTCTCQQGQPGVPFHQDYLVAWEPVKQGDGAFLSAVPQTQIAADPVPPARWRA